MYHYVRPLEQTRYPEIKGLRVSEFRAQLAHIRRHYQPVTVRDVAYCLRCGQRLPPNAILLTFDDGYLDHYTYVFPLLHEAHIQGAFFPPVNPVRNGQLLDVNRIHFILASVENKQALVEGINRSLSDYGPAYGLKTAEQYWAEWGKASRFDTAQVMYIKYMLQVALPEAIRTEITERLFHRFVTSDEVAFAREVYMDTDQLRMMQRCDMYIGSHGVTHRWLNSLSPQAQREEIEGSLAFLREVGSPTADYWVMCYPYGASDESLRDLLKEYHCALGLTTQVGVADLERNDALLLPRRDTNDLPKQ
jgi:peptidoglycan/xylan/chitin deacetylase (PgdA/CDA1 family)